MSRCRLGRRSALGAFLSRALILVIFPTAGLVFGQDPPRPIVTVPYQTPGTVENRELQRGESVVHFMQDGRSAGSIHYSGPKASIAL